MTITDRINATTTKEELRELYLAEIKPYRQLDNQINNRKQQIEDLLQQNAADINTLAVFGDVESVMNDVYLHLGRIEGQSL